MHLENFEIASLLVCLLGSSLYLYLKYHYNFWKRHRVAQITPRLIFGNFFELLTLRKSAAEYAKDLYNHFEAVNQSIVGIHVFHKPALVIRNPDLIKRILIKDFSKFSNRYATTDQNNDPLGSKNIFFIKNPAWKEIRSKLSPFFTNGKLKQMFPLIEEIGRNLDAYLCSLQVDATTQAVCVELKDLCSLYTTDVIATLAYGIQANCFRYPNGEFRQNGREIFRFTAMRAIVYVTIFFLPQLVPLFRFKILPHKSCEFLRSTINHVMRERKLSGERRNDLIDILIEFENSAKSNEELNHIAVDNDVLVAQAALFFTAGFETSSSTMSFALYELSKRQDLQERLRQEIHTALDNCNGKITFEMINSLEFLHMVLQEVLRLYPLIPFLDRECTLKEGETYSLQPFSDFRITRGMPVYIPVYGIHRDKQYFPDPNSFQPDRFSSENKTTINPITYLPFGSGPHSCIGERLGLLQTKVGLVNFLRHHYVTNCEKSHPTMKLNPRAMIIQSEGGIYCNVVRVNN